MIPAVLTIAASDPSGGAGIEADLKVFARQGVFGMSAITALTVQNAAGLQEVLPTPVATFRKILAALAEDQPIKAIKIGVLPNVEIVEVVANFLAERQAVPVVLDPVLAASRGGKLAEPGVAESIVSSLYPLITLLTPNLDEITTLNSLDDGGRRSKKPKPGDKGERAVLIKGGHGGRDPEDILFIGDTQGRRDIKSWKQPRLEGEFHGLGCALSSAIACNLALGCALVEAVEKARAYVYEQMKKAITTPSGIKVLPHI